jgi:trans-2,3-dihydro-3-hydroxyanthranilate isomerase
MKLHFITVDVFTDQRFGGNPLAVVLDANVLSTEQMQAIAAEFNYAETTFVLPPQHPENTAHVRIFTPRAEMPFAGHPNVGTAFVLAQLGRANDDTLVFEEKAGLVRMDIIRDGGAVVATRLAAPQLLEFGENIAPDTAAAAVGLTVDDIVGQPIVASTGVQFVFVELATRGILKKARPNNAVFAEHLPMDRTVGIHLFAVTPEYGVDIQTRMFAPLYGIPEDPATGGASVTLIGLLAHRDKNSDITMTKTIRQGFDMGRRSILEATAEKKDGNVIANRIGGRCVPMMSGTIDVV